MSIKEAAETALARVPTDQHNLTGINPETGTAEHIAVYIPVNRLEWIEVLKEAKPTDAADAQLVAELLAGSLGSPASEVGILAVQALAVCSMSEIVLTGGEVHTYPLTTTGFNEEKSQ